MKRTTIFAVALLLSVTSFATGTLKKNDEPRTLAIANNSENQFKLVYLEKSSGTVNIYLKNESGQVLHRANVQNKEGFAQNFDLSSLPAGDYTFAVKSASGTSLQEKVEVTHAEKQANFNADVLNVNDAKKFRLAVLNKDDQALNTTISIFDKNGNQIHTETVDKLIGFRKMYDMASVTDDSFTFEIKNSSGTKYITAE